MCGIESMIAIAGSGNHFADISKMVGGVCHPDHFVDANKMIAPHPRTKGAEPHSPGQRPGNAPTAGAPSPIGAQPTHGNVWVTPRWGLMVCGWSTTRGDAPGYRVNAPLARKNPRTKGAKPHSPGQRPGFAPPRQNRSPERAKPNTSSHEIEAWRAVNVTNPRVIS